MAKKSTAGSIPELSIENTELFNFEDLGYVFSWKEKIDTLYNKLRLIYNRSNVESTRVSYTEFAKKNKLDTRLMKVLKHYGYCNSSSEWILDHPTKGDAIFIQLKIRDEYRKLKKG